jgi:hypothetical protein
VEDSVTYRSGSADYNRDLSGKLFFASGTVGEVAYKMGRRFVLLDLADQELQKKARVPPLALVVSAVPWKFLTVDPTSPPGYRPPQTTPARQTKWR